MTNIEKIVKNTIYFALEEASISLSDIAWVLTANISKPILNQQLDRFFHSQLDTSVWDIGSKIGHLGAADQLVALHLLGEKIRSNQHVVLFGGGTGYNITILILKKL